MIRYITLLLLNMVSMYLLGQNLPPIQTDRPDQTECPFIVPKNHFQMENGFNYERVSHREYNFFYPSTLWKYGVNEKFELRLITELTANTNTEEQIMGLNPVRIGFKTKLTDEKGIIPTTSFIAHLAIPVLASGNFKTSYFAPDFRFTMQHALNHNVSLGYNLGAAWDGESPAPTFIYTLTTGLALTDKLGVYAEVYGFAPQQSQADHRIDGGVAFFVKPNFLLDLSGGFGLTENAPKYYVSLGISVRLPD